MPDEWYYTQDGRGRGPVTEARLEELITTGQLRPNDILWQEGMTQKIKVETVLTELERQAETPAEAPGQEEAPEPPAPATVPDQLQDVAAEPVRPAGEGPPTRQPKATPRDWREDERKGTLPPRRAGPPPAPPSAQGGPEAEAAQPLLAGQAPSPPADVELVPPASDLTPAPAAQETARGQPGRSPAGPHGQAPRNLAPLGSFVLSACALVLSLVALGLHFFADPLGPGLARYDFTTPKAALVSQAQIQLRHDVRAALELQTLTAGGNLQEKLNTLEVPKEADWNGVRILFLSYREDGVKRYETAGFEKNARTGLWAPAPVSLGAVREQDPELAKQIESWEKDGHF